MGAPALKLSKHLLGGVGHVEEAVVILVVPVDLSHAQRHAGQPAVVHQQVEGLRGQQRHAVPATATVAAAPEHNRSGGGRFLANGNQCIGKEKKKKKKLVGSQWFF